MEREQHQLSSSQVLGQTNFYRCYSCDNYIKMLQHLNLNINAVEDISKVFYNFAFEMIFNFCMITLFSYFEINVIFLSETFWRFLKSPRHWAYIVSE